MLLLLFQAGSERYALEGRRVLEVVSQVPLKSLQSQGESQAQFQGMAGLMLYRDRLIPVLDLGVLLQGIACRSLISTRIILVHVPAVWENAEAVPSCIGLMAERVTEAISSDSLQVLISSLKKDSNAYLGSILRDSQGIIQLINLDALLSQAIAHPSWEEEFDLRPNSSSQPRPGLDQV